MKATFNGMKDYSTAELDGYISRTNEKYFAAPAFIRRTSYLRWPNNREAITREIYRREGLKYVMPSRGAKALAKGV